MALLSRPEMLLKNIYHSASMPTYTYIDKGEIKNLPFLVFIFVTQQLYQIMYFSDISVIVIYYLPLSCYVLGFISK
jgi:hypothetical protein